MNDNALSTPAITIAAAGARLREIVPHIMDLEAATVAPGVSDSELRPPHESRSLRRLQAFPQEVQQGPMGVAAYAAAHHRARPAESAGKP